MSYTAPVEKLHLSEASQDTNSATSSTSPILPIGIFDNMYSSTSGAVRAFIGVEITAGAIALTSMFSVANSFPADLVRPITAAFDAE